MCKRERESGSTTERGAELHCGKEDYSKGDFGETESLREEVGVFSTFSPKTEK